MTAQMTSILSRLDQEAVSQQVQIESRNREVHLPPVSVYRWWARRTAAVNGAILDAAVETLDAGDRLFFADPFAGGGVIPMAALSRGHRVYAQDLNPWVAEGLATALALPSEEEIKRAGANLIVLLRPLAQEAYGTTFEDGHVANISQTFRVAVGACTNCSYEQRLYPHALVTLLQRKDRKLEKRENNTAYLACPNGHLFRGTRHEISKCPDCQTPTDPKAVYLPKRINTCLCCSHQESLNQIAAVSGLGWEIVLVERSFNATREIGPPTVAERRQADCHKWTCKRDRRDIPDVHETRVLRRHGFKSWNDIYTKRQRRVMEKTLALIDALTTAKSVKRALRMAALGTAEMAGHLSRWDRYYLKSYESMASHRFNFTTFTTEPNVLGLNAHGRGSLVKRLAGLRKAAKWLEEQNINFYSSGPIHANKRIRRRVSNAGLNVVCGSSERMLFGDKTVDLILTDPPYHDDVEYHELSLPFRAWAELPLERPATEAGAIPHSRELTGQKSYREQLIPIFLEFKRVLKPSGRLVFSYANRQPAAWVNLFAALKTAKLSPLGFTIVHSENDTETSKRRGRSCNLDLVLELVPASLERLSQWRPKPIFHTEEERYLLAVGRAFLKSGTMVNGWEEELVAKLKSEAFVAPRTDTERDFHAGQILRPNFDPRTDRRTKVRMHTSEMMV